MSGIFKQSKVQAKLLMLYSAVILAGVVIMVWSVITINRMDKLTREILAADQEASEAQRATTALWEIAVADLSYVVYPDSALQQEHSKHRGDLGEYVRKALIRSDAPSIRNALYQVEQDMKTSDEHFEALLLAAQQEDYEGVYVHGTESAYLMIGTVAPNVQEIFDEIIGIIEDRILVADALSTQSVIIAGTAGVLFLLLAIAAASIVTRQIAYPIMLITDATKAVENGTFKPDSLARLATRKDEIGRLARAFILAAAESKLRQETLRARADELRAKLAKPGVIGDDGVGVLEPEMQY